MRTADRLLADGLRPPFNPRSVSPALAAAWLDESAKTIRWLSGATIIVADNVAAYVAEHDDDYSLENFPCLAPPWPIFWIEYPNSTGHERRGALVRDVTGEPKGRDGSFQNAVDDARRNGYEGEIRWLIDLAFIAEASNHHVLGPVGWLVLALDTHGRCVGNRWVVNGPDGARVIDEMSTTVEEWMLAALIVALQTISFLHCSNAAVDVVEPPPRLSAKHRRRHGRPLVRYHTLRLEVPRRNRSGESTGKGLPPPLHIVPGHFVHFGDCCPPTCDREHGFGRCSTCGGHAPHGRLFGRLEGVFWVTQHLRGDPKRGTTVTDYDLVLK